MGSYFSKQVEQQPLDQVIIDNINAADHILSNIEIDNNLMIAEQLLE